jgi:hypothetical protein
MTLLYQLFVLQFQIIISYYIIFSKKTITSLISVLLYQFFLKENIIAFIAIITLLFSLFFKEYIIAIITIIALLDSLFLC